MTRSLIDICRVVLAGHPAARKLDRTPFGPSFVALLFSNVTVRVNEPGARFSNKLLSVKELCASFKD